MSGSIPTYFDTLSEGWEKYHVQYKDTISASDPPSLVPVPWDLISPPTPPLLPTHLHVKRQPSLS